MNITNKTIGVIFLVLMCNVTLFPHTQAWFDESHDPINSITEFVLEVCLDLDDSMSGDDRAAEHGGTGNEVLKHLIIYDRFHFGVDRSYRTSTFNSPPPSSFIPIDSGEINPPPKA